MKVDVKKCPNCGREGTLRHTRGRVGHDPRIRGIVRCVACNTGAVEAL